jgi:dipeptide transport system permease protein
MFKLIVRRCLVALPTLFGVSLVAFAFIRLVPGDPILAMLGERGVSDEMYAEMSANLGLDKPAIQQYFTFMGKALTGDFGNSISSRVPVIKEFFSRFPATLELGLSGMFLAILLGIPLGIIAAVNRNSKWDYALMGTSLVGYSMPIFWWALVLIMFFSVKLGWTPVSGRISVMYDIPQITGLLLVDSWFSDEPWMAFKSALHHLLLPTIVLATIPLASIARMTRSSLLEVLREDYIRTAKAKGLNLKAVVVVHALRNALIPIITVIGLMLGAVLTGAILTETIFSWPGIGRWLVTAVEARDYPIVQGSIMLIAFVIILVNLIVDIFYIIANPTLRSEN